MKEKIKETTHTMRKIKKWFLILHLTKAYLFFLIIQQHLFTKNNFFYAILRI